MESVVASMLVALSLLFVVGALVAWGQPIAIASLLTPASAMERRRRRSLVRWAADHPIPCAVGGGLLGSIAPMPIGPIAAIVFAALGARAPRILLARAGGRRRSAVDRQIPQLLDLLAAASSAGLSAPLALERAAEAVSGPLGEELDAVVRTVSLGARWREELHSLAERLDLPDMRRTVAALTRTETLGSSLASSTAELAERVRQARRAATTERARTAPVKMLFPLVFLVLPAFLLLTVVPVLLTTMQSIR